MDATEKSLRATLALYREALGALAWELEQIDADPRRRGVATARADGKGAGWVIGVVDAQGTERLSLHTEGGGEFAPHSAGHRLIEHGWMTYSGAHLVPERPAGWLRHPDGRWTAPVHDLDAPDEATV